MGISMNYELLINLENFKNVNGHSRMIVWYLRVKDIMWPGIPLKIYKIGILVQ